MIAGITAEEFDPLSSSFNAKLNGSLAAGLKAVNAAASVVNAGSYDDNLKGGERRESQMDLLQQSQDSQGVPQLCGVNCTVRKVRAGATSGSCLCV